MTVAQLFPTTGYRRPAGLERAALRIGTALVAWAHNRARLHDATRAERRRRGSHLALLEAERESALARAYLMRSF